MGARRSGVAGCMARAAQGRGPVALLSAPPALPMIAMLALPTGWQGGVLPRRTGAAGMQARAAHRQLEVVLRKSCELSERCTRGGALALAPSSGDPLSTCIARSQVRA